jgi:DNA repair photolyase
MFADSSRNPAGAKLFLLTKTANVHYLAGLPTANVLVTFSLNPESIADLWEGKWPDTHERITPAIDDRLAGSLEVQRMGFEVRWRIDPILTPDGWRDHYEEFFAGAARQGHRPARITLGTYRESTPQLQRWRAYWGVLPMEWSPATLRRDGTHWHIAAAERVRIYRSVAKLCRRYFPASIVSLCKETKHVRTASGLCSPSCNCLGDARHAPGALLSLPVIQP